MELRFGRDFSHVRVHNDATGEDSARAVQARAYTVGEHVVFGAGAYEPGTTRGRFLLGHELAHVLQQRRGAASAQRASVISEPSDRAEQEADRVGAALARPHAVVPPVSECRTATLARSAFVDAVITDIEAAGKIPFATEFYTSTSISMFYVKYHFNRNLGVGELTKAADYPAAFKKNLPPPSTTLPSAKKPAPETPPQASSIPVTATFFPARGLNPRARALVLGGFHGDERPGWEMAEGLIKDLEKDDTYLGFDTLIVPRVNAAAIEDELAGVKYWRNRCNRQLVDLNRNFDPSAAPADVDCVNNQTAPVQPEVQAVKDLVTTFKPDRIVSAHAISTPSKAGVYADPNAVKMKTGPSGKDALAIAKEMSQTIVNPSDHPGNKPGGAFNPVYPGDVAGELPSGGSSLGAWGPTAVSGKTIPVITIEAPGFSSLGQGPGTKARTVEAFLRPLRRFVEDPSSPGDEDDDIIRDIDAITVAERLAFLTGKLKASDPIFGRIRGRVENAVTKLNANKPPKPLKIVSSQRMFSKQVPLPGGTPQAQIFFNKFFMRGGFANKGWDTLPTSFFQGGSRTNPVDRPKWLSTPTKDRLAIIVRFSALPGASRHHWATEVDLNSVDVADWQAGGQFAALGPWLQANAPPVGLMQAYTSGRAGGYNEEPWHFSYFPLSIPLLTRYNKQVDLKADVIDVVVSDVRNQATAKGETMPADFATEVGALAVASLVNDINPDLK